MKTPSGGAIFSSPAVWRKDGATWLFAADGGATAAWMLKDRRLVAAWRNDHGGTSPVLAGGLLYVFDPGGKLRVYQPDTGAELAALECGGGHWNSAIVVDGRIALPEGNSNRGDGAGTMVIWRLH